MKTIWKFEFETKSEMHIDMPKGAIILDVQTQKGSGCIWALVDPNEEKETRSFKVFGTGHVMPEERGKEYSYCGTYQVTAANLVFHLFEVVSRTKRML